LTFSAVGVALLRPLAKALEAPVLPFPGKKSMSHTLKLCSVKELKSFYGIPYSRQHIWRLIGAHQFPHAVKLGQCRVAFRCSDVEEWIQERIDEATRQGELSLR
jgi:predicted DNA-binding transcriptional regulator AlpA